VEANAIGQMHAKGVLRIRAQQHWWPVTDEAAGLWELRMAVETGPSETGHIQSGRRFDNIHSVYVIDEHGSLVGAAPLVDLCGSGM
jgi:hypothetical protein